MRNFVFAGLAVILLVGCSGAEEDQWTKNRPQTYQAGGLVTFDGQPLSDATVVFKPADSDGNTAVGRTDAEGRFVLQTFGDKDGAIAGKHLVTVTKVETTKPPEGANLDEINFVAEERSLIPTSYGVPASSKLTAEVKADGENDFTFELTSK